MARAIRTRGKGILVFAHGFVHSTVGAAADEADNVISFTDFDLSCVATAGHLTIEWV